MRCYICNSVLSEPQFNQEHGNYDPCETCLEVIQDLVDGYKDKPSMDEDDFTEVPLDELRHLPTPHRPAQDDY